MLVYGWIVLALLLAPVQFFIIPPYGRHARGNWGPQISNRSGWIIMELVAPLALLLPFVGRGIPTNPVIALFMVMFLVHYLYRALIYPFTMRTTGKRIPLLIVLFAVGFNAINGWMNGYYLAGPWAHYPSDWITDWRFIAGVALFLAGAIINQWADRRLVNLRGPGKKAYSIPRGGLFEFVSCPNHFGEILEWAGFALACWNLPAAAFAAWTASNLVPRAVAHHRWYRENFPTYPSSRKALIPFLL